MQETNKKFKLVSNKKTRTILPNMFTLVGVCIGLTSIKFAFDEKFGLAIICIIVAGLIDGDKRNFSSRQRTRLFN